VPSKSQRKPAGTLHRVPASKRLVRLEVDPAPQDARLIKAVAKTLRGEPKRAKALRATLEEALVGAEVKTAFDVFGTDLPDEVFADVFDQPRQGSWREIDL
jgi:hypothetical protein